MAKVLGRGLRSGERYEAWHPFERDRGIVRLIKIEGPKAKTDAESQGEQVYKVLIDAQLCRRVRSQLGFKKEKMHATIGRLLSSLDPGQMAAIKSVPIGDLFKIRSKGARIIGDYVDPNRIYKAIELCGRGLVRLEPYSYENEAMPMYEIKIPLSLVQKIRTNVTEGDETLSQTISKVLTFLVNTQGQRIK